MQEQLVGSDLHLCRGWPNDPPPATKTSGNLGAKPGHSAASPPPTVAARLPSAVLAPASKHARKLMKKTWASKKVRMVANIGRGLALAAPPCLAILLYCNTLNHGFVYDDR